MRRLFLCFVVAWLAAFAYFVALVDILGPYMDDWNSVYLLKAIEENALTARLLFERFYGAHTPALARLLFSAEYFIFQGTNILPKAVALLAIAGTWLIAYRNIEAARPSDKYWLGALGIVLAFSPAQLYTFSYPWSGLQHPTAIFLSLLAIHLLTQDVRNGNPITVKRTLGCLALCGLAALFTAIGLFAMLTICAGLLVLRAPARTLVAAFSITVALLVLLRPDDIILRVGPSLTDTLYLKEHVIIEKTGALHASFWPYYPRYLMAFTGALFETVSLPLSVAAGTLFFVIVATLLLKWLRQPGAGSPFFFLTASMLIGYALVAAWGRYQSSDYQFDRYSAIYPWLLWSGCLCTLQMARRTGLILCVAILAGTLLTAAAYINRQLLIQQQVEQADLNMVNNSLSHMTYYKVAMPLKMFGFTPAVFHNFQKAHQWSIYREYRLPDLSEVSRDRCEAVKTKEFVISEKKFVEYQLSAWNLSEDRYLPRIYALNHEGHIVAQGAAIRKNMRWLPRFWTPREDLLMYLIVPREHPLGTLRLVGGSPGNYCEVTLRKK